MNPVEVIRKKRDGEELSPDEIRSFIRAAVAKEIPEYQATAFLMATYFQGMTGKETAGLTEAMMTSGRTLSFRNEPKAVRFVDKHSTGGVGDKISLILAPLCAALGLKVPMVAGRGLGHTGGTLDKLESISGFSVHLSLDAFEKQVYSLGCCIIGQTDEFVPADKLLYSLRDVTATVDCVPLITASILSKKVAEGITGLVLDIKVGSGAFMKNMSDAQTLAKSLLATGKQLGLSMRAVLTDMNQPLGVAIGNSLEVLECLHLMKGCPPNSPYFQSMPLLQDVKDLTVELAAHMLLIGEKASSLSAARLMARKALQDGSALKKFKEMCDAQGAKINVIEESDRIPVSHHVCEVVARRSGYVTKMNGEELGKAAVDLGGGRHIAADVVDPSVGILISAKIGTQVKKGATLARVYFSPEHLKKKNLSLDSIVKRIESAITVGQQKTPSPKLIRKVMS